MDSSLGIAEGMGELWGSDGYCGFHGRVDAAMI
jgi:hypothetical protein